MLKNPYFCFSFWFLTRNQLRSACNTPEHAIKRGIRKMIRIHWCNAGFLIGVIGCFFFLPKKLIFGDI